VSIPKVFGIETEYGIAFGGDPKLNAMVASTLVVSAYKELLDGSAEWDFHDEHPERDARGFEVPGDKAPTVEPTLTNVVLPNGARLYVDHAHPEYSTPECSDPLELVIHDLAGVVVMRRAVSQLLRNLPVGHWVRLYKNNSDGKGNSYGCHENYLVDRSVPFEVLTEKLLPHLISRQIYCGAGKVGAEAGRGQCNFQISQRADFFEEVIGLETTIRRPIVNTRDEPHADPQRFRRLHVIVGDANMAHIPTFLKIGTTALILQMIEDGFIEKDLSLKDPVASLHSVSRDLSCKQVLERTDGTTITAVELQWNYYELAQKWRESYEHPPWTPKVLDLWREILEGLERDPLALASKLDWVAKWSVVQAYKDSRGIDWNDPKLAMIDLQYHDLRPDRGLYWKLEAEGRIDTLASLAEAERAESEPPESTRAYFRGRAIRRFAPQIVSANWDSIVFDTGASALQRLPMMNPTKGTKDQVGDLLDGCADLEELLDALTS
jgi:proteasome accessory factor PafA2